MNAIFSKDEMLKVMSDKILILDGAMGTMIQKENLLPADFGGKVGNNDILNITRRDIIKKYMRHI